MTSSSKRGVAAIRSGQRGMHNRRAKLIASVALLLVVQGAPMRASADNRMGYRLLSSQAAATLPRRRGSLGMDIDKGEQITDDEMTFDIIRVKGVRNGSPAAQAGLRPGDQIIAIDGRVFPSLTTFAAYVGSVQPGTLITVDYMPADGGPAQAQRVSVTVGAAGSGQPIAPSPPSSGISPSAKVAIGVGAAALLGCYELGCFSQKRPVQSESNIGAQGVAPRQ